MPGSRGPGESYLARRVARLVETSLQGVAAPTPDLPPCEAPAAFVALGLLLAPIGLKGAFRMKAFHAGDPRTSALMKLEEAVLRMPDGSHRRAIVSSVEPNGKDFRIQLRTVDTPEMAQPYVRAEIGVPRSALPAAAPDEAYWTDLLGCRVLNRSGEVLGLVDRMDTNGAHDWMIVGHHWIPFVEAYVDDVDLIDRTVRVDWQADW
ncbi:MAG: ribosome maturation factor RimM [Burkholderiaceae bacterium]|jgi:16S rRNA processing protein RimM